MTRNDRYPDQLLSDFMTVDAEAILTFHVKPGYDYHINLSEIKQISDLQRWTDHLIDKRWMSQQKLDYFYDYVEELKNFGTDGKEIKVTHK